MAKRFGKVKRAKEIAPPSKRAIAGLSSGRNANLTTQLKKKKVNPRVRAAINIPAPDTFNQSGTQAYKIDPFLRLLGILNTSKVEDEFYRTTTDMLKETINLIDHVGKKDPLLLAKMIVYSRCHGAGMRSINHFAAAYAARYISGNKWARRFYSARSRKINEGGTIFRTDDMSQIVNVYCHLNKGAIPNSMKKGFRQSIEQADAYTLLKYKKDILDIINIVRPNPDLSTALVTVANDTYRARLTELYSNASNPVHKKRYLDKRNQIDGRTASTTIKVLDAIILGIPASADTHEAANSEAGQLVKKALDLGQIDQHEAKELLIEAKGSNWSGLLQENKLGILAAIRNIRNILDNNPTQATVIRLCNLLQNDNALRNGKILPFQLDIANEIVANEFGNSQYGRMISQALLQGYQNCIPNLAQTLTGRTLVAIDQSGSMWMANARLYYGYKSGNDMKRSNVFAGDKALLMGATIAKAVNADVMIFGGTAEYINYTPNKDIFTLAKDWRKNLGSTSIASVWKLAQKKAAFYDRVIILSDYEANRDNTSQAYKDYIKAVADPYVYSIDLGMLGTTQLKGDKVRQYYGYSFETFDDISRSEWNPNYHMDKVKAIHI